MTHIGQDEKVHEIFMLDYGVHLYLAFSVLDICVRNMPEKASETLTEKKEAHSMKQRAISRGDLKTSTRFEHPKSKNQEHWTTNLYGSTTIDSSARNARLPMVVVFGS